MDDFNVVAQNANAGLAARWRVILPTREVELTGRLHCDLFLQDLYLLDGVPMKLELIRSPSDFYLMSAGDVECRFELTKAEFYVRQVNIDNAIQEQHVKHVATSHGQISFDRVQVTAHNIPGGGHDFHKDQLMGGHLPKRVVLGLVDNDAFAGSKEKNPFHFKHNVTSLKLKLNGRECMAQKSKVTFRTTVARSNSCT
ncbi:uncharacterized protein F54H12.2-like [Haliotis asinina]|uniref:uncharacterized protein F54H12.2-like n=1 Tax=Haliotis asinina TaxID=109174 RepID=UPI0035324D10